MKSFQFLIFTNSLAVLIYANNWETFLKLYENRYDEAQSWVDGVQNSLTCRNDMPQIIQIVSKHQAFH